MPLGDFKTNQELKKRKNMHEEKKREMKSIQHTNTDTHMYTTMNITTYNQYFVE